MYVLYTVLITEQEVYLVVVSNADAAIIQGEAEMPSGLHFPGSCSSACRGRVGVHPFLAHRHALPHHLKQILACNLAGMSVGVLKTAGPPLYGELVDVRRVELLNAGVPRLCVGGQIAPQQIYYEVL